MTNAEILVIYDGLRELRQDTSIKLPARAAFAIVRNIKTLTPIVEDIAEQKNNVLKAYGIPDKENPNAYYISNENRQVVNEELAELEQVEVELNLQKIKWEDIENIDLSVQAMDALCAIIEGEN